MTESDSFFVHYFRVFFFQNKTTTCTQQAKHAHVYTHTNTYTVATLVTGTTFEQTNIESNGLNWIGLKVD